MNIAAQKKFVDLKETLDTLKLFQFILQFVLKFSWGQPFNFWKWFFKKVGSSRLHFTVRSLISIEQVLCQKCLNLFEKHGQDLTNLILLPSNPYGLFGRLFFRASIIIDSKKLRPDKVVNIVFRRSSCYDCKKPPLVNVSPVLWANLTSCLPFPPGDSSDVKIVIGPVMVNADKEKEFARQVQIAQIKQPDSFVEQAVLDKALTQHFSVPKLLFQGGIFFINVNETDWWKAESNRFTKLTWFKVLAIKGSDLRVSDIGNECFWVDSEHSALFQSAAVSSFCPQVQTTFSSRSTTFWKDLSPVVFDKYMNRLQRWFCASKELHSCNSILLTILLYGPSGCGKTFIARCFSRRIYSNFYCVDCYDLWSEVSSVSEAKLKNVFQKAINNVPCVLLMKNVHVLGQDANSDQLDYRVVACLEDCIKMISTTVSSSDFEYPLVVLATCHTLDDVASEIATSFLYHVKIESLQPPERAKLLANLLENDNVEIKNLNLERIAQLTPGFVLADFDALIDETYLMASQRISENEDHASNTLEEEDLTKAIDSMQEAYGDSIGAPKVPDVHWSDVGGLSGAKEAVLETIQMSLEFSEVFGSLRRSGILLYGPPGCGKTLLAKAVATECRLTFLSVKGPELLNMYVGQSEQNVREVFERGRSAVPCIIFFDELDALAPNRGRSGDSGGVMDRVVSQLLAELDGVEDNKDLFVIGATNRPDLVDPSLLRPGRFDKMIHVGLNDTPESRLAVFQALTRNLSVNEDVNLFELAVKCPGNVSGADLYSLVSNATTKAMGRLIESIDAGYLKESDANLIVFQRDFEEAYIEMFQ